MNKVKFTNADIVSYFKEVLICLEKDDLPIRGICLLLDYVLRDDYAEFKATISKAIMNLPPIRTICKNYEAKFYNCFWWNRCEDNNIHRIPAVKAIISHYENKDPNEFINDFTIERT